MAATPLSVQTITSGGTTPAAEAAGDATNGNSVAGNNGKIWIEATNGGGSSGTVQVAFAYQVDGQTIPARSYTLAASAKRRLGPFDPAKYGTTLLVTPSATTITLAAWQLG